MNHRSQLIAILMACVLAGTLSGQETAEPWDDALPVHHAWYAPEEGIPEGTHDLGQLVEPGTAYEDLFFGYTPAEGPVGEMQGVDSFEQTEQ